MLVFGGIYGALSTLTFLPTLTLSQGYVPAEYTASENVTHGRGKRDRLLTLNACLRGVYRPLSTLTFLSTLTLSQGYIHVLV